MLNCSYQDVDEIEAEVWRQFDCHPVAAGRGGRQRVAKRDKVTATTKLFFEAMNSDNPPKTKDDAVTMLTPVLGLLLSIFFKQLAVMVIEWLWERTKDAQIK